MNDLEKRCEENIKKICKMNDINNINAKELMNKNIPNIFNKLMIKDKNEEKISKIRDECLKKTIKYKNIIDKEIKDNFIKDDEILNKEIKDNFIKEIKD